MALNFNFEKLAGSEKNGAVVTCVDIKEDSNPNKVYSFALELKYGKNSNNPEDWKLTDTMIFKDVRTDADPKEIKSKSGVRKLLKRLGLEKKLLTEKLIYQKPEIEMPEPAIIPEDIDNKIISYGSGKNLKFYALIETGRILRKDRNMKAEKNIYWLTEFNTKAYSFQGFQLMSNSEEYNQIANLENPTKVSGAKVRDILLS